MALIYDIKIPETLTVELHRLIDGCKIADLLHLAKHNPTLIRGFQPKESNAAIIRQRLKNALTKNGELDLPVADFIVDQSLNRHFVCVLSVEALEYCFDELMVTLGREPFIIGLLFDKRSDVRALAVDFLTTPHDLGKDVPRARNKLSEKLEQYIDVFSFVIAKNGAMGSRTPSSSKKSETTAQAKAQIKQLMAQLEASKCNRKEVNVLNKKLLSRDNDYQQLQTELDKLKNNLRATKALNAALDKTATETREQLEQLQRQQQEIISSKVTEALEQTSYTWLKRPREMEQQVKNIANDNDLLSRADQVLAKQLELDKHYGNVRLLNERLQLLQAQSSRLVQAQKESIKPLPELSKINSEIITEINKLNKLLDKRPPERSFVDECIGRINIAKSTTDISETEKMLALFAHMKLLQDDELNELYAKYHAKVGMMFDKHQPSAQWTDNSLWWLYKLLRSNSQVYLLLDGHNILHLLPSIFSAFYEHNIPGGVAREQLIERMIAAVTNYPGCIANIFFDGPDPSEYSPAKNVKVIYSGGGNSEHRADRVLLRHLQLLADNGSVPAAAVITDDRDIQTHALKLNAKVISPVQFAGLLV